MVRREYQVGEKKKEKKTIDTKLEAHWPHAVPNDEGVITIIQTPLKAAFKFQTTLHTFEFKHHR